ncbi:polyadenylate-binding protein-interacting protein 1 [Diorhabda sublineata]|uniref:polyadenylate-binding protein-interacting protein 1 n=1 Tax=Diorhabda sublineata TaxID=1163346 RepID=UPI0024E0AE0F|nr:polyadenylate-binding protein-interacting protein 1 [Diorhabda sublineata]
MSEKPVLWEESDSNAPSKLRPPKFLSVPNNSSHQSTQTNSTVVNKSYSSNAPLQQNAIDIDEIVAKSKLSATANEWYPKNMEPIMCPTNSVGQVTSSIQNRLKAHKVQPEPVPVSNVYNADVNNEFPSDLHRIKKVISTLTKDPGQFHNLLDLFMETLEPYLMEEDLIVSSQVAEIIVEQAINHPNFRYTGARLCWCIEQGSPTFRAELHLRCKKQIEENPDTKNVVPLIAELYTQLPHLTVYGSLLIEAFNKLLELGGNENIKCICQSLKLTGYSLEQSNKQNLDQVFHHLKSLKGRIGGSAAILLDSIFQLRASNWGHSTEELSDSDQDNDVFDGLPTKVMYDIDGGSLTTEESEFIASHINSNEDYDTDDFDPDELCDPEPEMDEEIQEAFKEFLRFSSGKH